VISRIQKTGLVLFNRGAFGGAPKRFTSLYFYLNQKYPGKFVYIINNHLLNQIMEIFPSNPLQNIEVIDEPLSRDSRDSRNSANSTSWPRFYKGTVPDLMETHKKTSFPRKTYQFFKNMLKQYRLYRKIEKLRMKHNIEVFVGIFSGILPLMFYMNSKQHRPRIIYSDMDSWFTDIHPPWKSFWYRKYFSFNYALENSDTVDFLSPYVLKGVRERGVKIPEERVSISPCSFTDYTRCSVGDKRNFEVAFAARLEPDKNPLMYLEAAREILKSRPDVKFHLLGEGTLVKEINDFIENNRLKESVNFSFHPNPPEIFKDTSVFVSLQANNNYPSQSILEAMGCGCAVIAPDNGDTHLLVNENTGILISLEIDALVRALEKLISSPELTQRLGSNARKFVLENHTIEKYSEYFLNLLYQAPQRG